MRFDSLSLPDGTDLPLQAVGTDLWMRPLRGKVQGKNAGKNLLVRSVSGVGQIAATLMGRGSLNQPLSEGDLLRERVTSNIGHRTRKFRNSPSLSAWSSRSRLILRSTWCCKRLRAHPALSSSPTEAHYIGADRNNIDELRQLLQLQGEVNQQTTASNQSQ